MLRKSFSVASAVGLSGLVVWVGCSSDDQTPGTGTGTADAGTDASGQVQDSAVQDPGAEGGPGVGITYGKCTEFIKCGGDVVGNWVVSGGCLSEATFASAKKTCSGLKESDVVLKASGTLTVTPTEIARKTTIDLTAKLLLPKSCLPPLPFPIPCVAVGLALTADGGVGPGGLAGGLAFDKATCVDAPNESCECEVADSLKEDQPPTTYTTADGTLKTPAKGAVKEQTYDYCVTGNKLTFSETTPAQPLKLTVEVTK